MEYLRGGISGSVESSGRGLEDERKSKISREAEIIE
jgi:hypothetical protein